VHFGGQAQIDLVMALWSVPC